MISPFLQTRGAAAPFVSHEQRHGPEPAVKSSVGGDSDVAVGEGEVVGIAFVDAVLVVEPLHAATAGAAVLVTSAILRAKERNRSREISMARSA